MSLSSRRQDFAIGSFKLGGTMKVRRWWTMLAMALVAAWGGAARGQSYSQPQNQQSGGGQSGWPKAIYAPAATYPEEARRKNIDGTVVLRFVVEADGSVSDATVVSGPEELQEAAIDAVKQWRFEPPAKPPVTMTAEVSFGHPKQCDGSLSDRGYVSLAEPITGKRGAIVEMEEDGNAARLTYSRENRTARVEGEMILSVGVNGHGEVKKVRVVKGLAPELDKDAAETIRAWKFKVKDGSAKRLPDEFEMHLSYQARCRM